MDAVAKRVGITRFNLKLFRHTYPSHLLVYENAPVHYVQAQLGHHSPDFALRVYGNLLAPDRGRYADRLDDWAVITEVRDTHPEPSEYDRRKSR